MADDPDTVAGLIEEFVARNPVREEASASR
jgi:hypothetical protein